MASDHRNSGQRVPQSWERALLAMVTQSSTRPLDLVHQGYQILHGPLLPFLPLSLPSPERNDEQAPRTERKGLSAKGSRDPPGPGKGRGDGQEKPKMPRERLERERCSNFA